MTPVCRREARRYHPRSGARSDSAPGTAASIGRAQRVAGSGGLDAEQRTHRLDERREGRATGRVAVRGQHGRLLPQLARQLVDEPRLAEPWRSEDRRQARATAW